MDEQIKAVTQHDEVSKSGAVLNDNSDMIDW